MYRGKTRVLTPLVWNAWRGPLIPPSRVTESRKIRSLIAAVFAILTAVALATEAEAASYRTDLWTTFCTTGSASYCQVYAQAIASALMVQRRICLSTTTSSLTLADVALRYKRLQPDKVPVFAVDLLVDAFTAAWPCANGERQQQPARPIAQEWIRDFWAGGDASDPATVYAWGITELLTRDHLVCLPPALRPVGLSTQIALWLRERPDLLTAPAAVVMLQALPALWPCQSSSRTELRHNGA